MADDPPLTDAERADVSRAELLTTIGKLRDVVVALIGLSRNLESRVQMLEVEALDRISRRPSPDADPIACPVDGGDGDPAGQFPPH